LGAIPGFRFQHFCFLLLSAVALAQEDSQFQLLPCGYVKDPPAGLPPLPSALAFPLSRFPLFRLTPPGAGLPGQAV
jgi:hypothetical protein